MNRYYDRLLPLFRQFLLLRNRRYLRIVLSPEEASCLQVFLNVNVLQGGVVSTSPNPQAGGPPLVGCPRLLIQFILSYPP